MADSPLRDTVLHYKETEKGVSSMCKELEKIVEEAESKGQATGRLAQLRDLVKKGLLTLSTAAREAGMTEDAFRKAARLGGRPQPTTHQNAAAVSSRDGSAFRYPQGKTAPFRDPISCASCRTLPLRS